MNIKFAIAVSAALFVYISSIAQVLPGDGAVLTVYSVEADVADAGAGAVCDLSDVVILGSEEMSFRYYGDSTVCRKSNMAVEWYEIKGDTVWSLGRNTRVEAMRYRNGAPYLILGSGDACSTVDSLRHLSLMLFDRENITGTEYFAEEGCGFVFSAADTVASTYCVHTVTADSLFTTHCRRWYAPGCVWPVAEDVTLTSNGSNMAYALYICPPSEQSHLVPRAAAKSHTNPGNDSSSKNCPRPINPDNPADGLVYSRLAAADRAKAGNIEDLNIAKTLATDIAPTPSGLRISIDGAATPSTIRLYDDAGRLWREASGTSISTDRLPPGTYLIEIATPARRETRKIQIRQ